MPVPVALFWASWLSGSDVPSRKVLKQEGHYFRCELQEFCQYFASGADDHQPKPCRYLQRRIFCTIFYGRVCVHRRRGCRVLK
ncbi:uncharacterized protein [Physcomitrium patens]|uniref:uncharacterized protein isoform X2 n=1 Tax=Physcomitrium patens TaxID=3218 RepID=UPI000D16B359|nr:uncharacterized protein LOC112288303 isoform X2 [Physcomitrium patens]|eukprot:XP_024388140.1 uncharacterized protein LOC112288303 isoform X2 [Physcomitrella patens]